jgi:hypothetical protein
MHADDVGNGVGERGAILAVMAVQESREYPEISESQRRTWEMHEELQEQP